MPSAPARTPLAASLVLAALIPASSAVGQLAPALDRIATKLGRQAPAAPVSGTVWLPLHNKAALDAAVENMYTAGSPGYHKFLSPAELRQFAPASAEVERVKTELAAHNLTVVKADPDNYFVKFAGQTSDFEQAFHTAVSQYRTKGGATVRALTTEPTLGGDAAGLFGALTGISGPGMRSYLRHPASPVSGEQTGRVAVAALQNPEGAVFASQCFYLPETLHLLTANVPAATAQRATYTGLVYGAAATNSAPGTKSPCAYAPQDIAKLYGLNTAYSQGFTGAGQTIAIVDPYGSPTLPEDLATFNTLYKLSPATSANFATVQTTPFTATDSGWAEEATLDVEWSHAVAPGARILLVTVPTASDDDLQAGLLYIIKGGLANVISNSYGTGEKTEDLQTAQTWDQICEMAAAEGISVNFATGDDGDFAAVESGLTDVSIPADSPHATAVGGTSLARSPWDSSTLQTGWGDNQAVLGVPGVVLDPPLLEGFQFGSGGGISQYFAAPSYQAGLHAGGRALPDVAALADPLTGVEAIFTVSGVQYVTIEGGTSLATPIFSAEWALLNQRFGYALGQAAPYVARAAGSKALDDMVAPPEAALVTGIITDVYGTTDLSADSLGQVAQNTPFDSALSVDAKGNVLLYTFGTDSSLQLAPGWDPVTGWGTLDMGNIFAATASKK